MSAAKVYRVDRTQLLALLTGRARITNLPADAQIVGFAPCTDRGGECLGLRVHSQSFPDLHMGAQLPVVIAVVRSNQERAAA